MKNISQRLLIEENRQLTHKTWKLTLSGCDVKFPRPGNFVNIAVPGKYLRRPISVHWYSQEERILTLVYDVAGEGTSILSKMIAGEYLDVLVDLGNGFSIPEEISCPILIGGGIGVAPLSQLAVELKKKGKFPIVVFCYNTHEDIIPDLGLANEGIDVEIATVDGSAGIKGYFSDVISAKNINFDYFYACGPLPMLRAVSSLPTKGEISMECRMGCGFGACMCCSLETRQGAKRICKEGPVFFKDDLIWK